MALFVTVRNDFERILKLNKMATHSDKQTVKKATTTLYAEILANQLSLNRCFIQKCNLIIDNYLKKYIYIYFCVIDK